MKQHIYNCALALFMKHGYENTTVDDIAERVRLCLSYAPAEKLAFAPDCGLSQTARWAAKQKLSNIAAGVEIVRQELGLY